MLLQVPWQGDYMCVACAKLRGISQALAQPLFKTPTRSAYRDVISQLSRAADYLLAVEPHTHTVSVLGPGVCIPTHTILVPGPGTDPAKPAPIALQKPHTDKYTVRPLTRATYRALLHPRTKEDTDHAHGTCVWAAAAAVDSCCW